MRISFPRCWTRTCSAPPSLPPFFNGDREKKRGGKRECRSLNSAPQIQHLIPLRWPLKGGVSRVVLSHFRGVKCFGKILLFAPRTQRRSFEATEIESDWPLIGVLCEQLSYGNIWIEIARSTWHKIHWRFGGFEGSGEAEGLDKWTQSAY